MRIFLAVITYFIAASGVARADCYLPPAEIIEIKVARSYAPVVDGLGNTVPGCIVKTGSESDDDLLPRTAYSPDAEICTLSKGETMKVCRDFGCCDTGPDDGELVCTVRYPEGGLGRSTVRANGIGFDVVERSRCRAQVSD